MDPASIFTLAASSAAVSWKVVESLYHLIHDTNLVNQTVRDLYKRTFFLAIVCDATDKHIQYLNGCTNGEQLKLFRGTEMILKDCYDLMSRLNKLIQGVEKEHNSFFPQAIRQIKLNLNDREIKAYKDDINSNITQLNLALGLLSHKDYHASQSPPGEPEPVARAHTLDAIPAWRSSSALPTLNTSVHGKPPSLHRSADSAVAFDHACQRVSSAPPTLTAKRPWDVPKSPRLRVVSDSRSTHTQEEEYDPDTYEARKALARGVEQFDQGAFADAQKSLREAVEETQQSEKHSGKRISLAGVDYKLAVCAYHVDESAIAEELLARLLTRQTATVAETSQVCHAAYLLTLIYARTDRPPLAVQTCEEMYWKAVVVYGEDHGTCHEALTLLAICYEALRQFSQADLCVTLIPSETRERLRLQALTSLHFPRRKPVQETSTDYLTGDPRRLRWSGDNTHLAWQESDHTITVYSSLSRHPRTVTHLSQPISAFALSENGQHVITASSSGKKSIWGTQQQLSVYDVDSGQCLQEIKAEHIRSTIKDIVISADGRAIALADGHLIERCTLSISSCRLAPASCIKIADQHGSPRFSPNGSEITIPHKRGVMIHQANSGNLVQYLEDARDRLTGGWAYSPDASQLAMIVSNRVVTFELSKARVLMDKRAFELPPVVDGSSTTDGQDITYLPDGRLLVARCVTAGDSRGLIIYDVQRERAYILDNSAVGYHKLAFSLDGTMLAAVAKSGRSIRTWDMIKAVRYDE